MNGANYLAEANWNACPLTRHIALYYRASSYNVILGLNIETEIYRKKTSFNKSVLKFLKRLKSTYWLVYAYVLLRFLSNVFKIFR